MSLGSQDERSAPSPPSLLKDLVADTVYTVKMTSTNAAGKKSPRTVGATFKTKSPTAPSAPWGISSIFACGGAIEVMWNPPEDQGGELLSSMGYKATAFSASPCYDDTTSSPCSRCNSVKFSDRQYQLIENASVCEQPKIQCPDTTLDCCLTREDSEYGFGVSCGLMTRTREPRAVVGTTSAIFNRLNYSSTYYFGVQAINRAGRGMISNLQGLQTT